MTEATITSRKDEMEKLKGYPIKKRRAILKARDEILAYSQEIKAVIKKALDQNQPVNELPPEISPNFLQDLRELIANSEAIRGIMLAALEAPPARIMTGVNFAGKSKDVMLQAFSQLNKPGKDNLETALKTGNAASLDKNQQQLFAIASFFIAIADDDTRRELGGIFSLSDDDLENVIARTALAGTVIFSPDDKQLFLPFDDWMPTAEKERLLVDMTQGTHSQNIRLAISKLAQAAPKLIPDRQQEYGIKVIPAKGNRKEVEISVIVDMPPEVTVNRKITFFDRMVEDAIGNLADDGYTDQAGNMAISPEMVYRQINGLADGEQISKTGVKRVNESMEKLAKTWCKIDCTEHLKAAGGKMTMDLQEATFGRAIIQGTMVYLKMKSGKEVTGWKITGRPLIYEYSKAIKQLATVERRVLETNTISNTPEVMQMRYYLLQQIERIRNKPGTPGEANVKYDTIFTDTGDTLPLEKTGTGRKTRTNRIKAIKALLDSFQAAGHIAGWREAGAGSRRQKTGVEIIPIDRKTLNRGQS